MNKISAVLKAIITILTLFISIIVLAQSTASYDITFTSTWENEMIDPVNGMYLMQLILADDSHSTKK